ncbi:uncharacterized protein LOC131008133 [Salvia miltiorrhiza]|uniref:uncharacterized protein LOC131008133 n=1 Tax=Salvia miltiorrhiza TaxID=226208 RepID=UPI0025ABD34F|nr:uncharacterized protein LOC131008133 [Salvia miltiorrhiza]
MSQTLQLQHQVMDVAAATIMLNLTEVFAESKRSARFNIMREILACEISESSSVHKHEREQLDLLGGGIDGETKVDIILNTLPKTYENFRLNAVMSKVNYSLNELLNALVTAKGVMGKGKEDYVDKHKSKSEIVLQEIEGIGQAIPLPQPSVQEIAP